MTHFEHLQVHVPDLLSRDILDVGSGKGAFLIEVASRGGSAVGIEKNPGNIASTLKCAENSGISVTVREGIAESLPFHDASFDFLNIAEVIEHVEDPNALIREACRVLRPGGLAYLSIPNRFGMKDPHFHLYFVNWLPRDLTEPFISIFRKHKEYISDSGRQRLPEMHYYTFSAIARQLKLVGFSVTDIRMERIKHSPAFLRWVVMTVYFFLRPWYFDTFHLLLKK